MNTFDLLVSLSAFLLDSGFAELFTLTLSSCLFESVDELLEKNGAFFKSTPRGTKHKRIEKKQKIVNNNNGVNLSSSSMQGS